MQFTFNCNLLKILIKYVTGSSYMELYFVILSNFRRSIRCITRLNAFSKSKNTACTDKSESFARSQSSRTWRMASMVFRHGRKPYCLMVNQSFWVSFIISYIIILYRILHRADVSAMGL